MDEQEPDIPTMRCAGCGLLFTDDRAGWNGLRIHLERSLGCRRDYEELGQPIPNQQTCRTLEKRAAANRYQIRT